MLANPNVVLDVMRGQVAVPVSIDLIEIPMRRRVAVHIILADIVRVSIRACEEQRSARQWS